MRRHDFQNASLAGPRFYLVIQRDNNQCSRSEACGEEVTPVLLCLAEKLLAALSELPDQICLDHDPYNFYDVCARAFGVPREEAKRRFVAALYNAGGKTAPTSDMSPATKLID